MDHIVALIEAFGLLAIFLNVLLDEGGLPLPASPLLAVAGALSARGELSLGAIIAAAVAGSFVADNSWYWIARYRGRQVLGLLCKLSLSPDACVRQTETLFARVGPGALLFAKFIPALGNITIALSGITRLPLTLFLPLELVGATSIFPCPWSWVASSTAPCPCCLTRWRAWVRSASSFWPVCWCFISPSAGGSGRCSSASCAWTGSRWTSW